MYDFIPLIIGFCLFVVSLCIAFSEKNYLYFIVAILPIIMMSWVIIAQQHVEKQLVKVTQSFVIDDVAYAKYGDRLYNLNDILRKNINAGTTIKIFKYETYKYGLVITGPDRVFLEIGE